MASAALVVGPLTRRWALSVWLVAAAQVVMACATVGGGVQALRVTTEPPGATVLANGANMGPAPARIKVKPEESSLTLRLEFEGYQPASIEVTRRKAGWLASNLPLASYGKNVSGSHGVGEAVAAAIVLAIDQATESANRLAPVAVHVVLVKR